METTFYTKIAAILQLDPEARHAEMRKLHGKLLPLYISAIEQISSEKAAQKSSDDRSIAQVVGHILEWDRFIIQSSSEIISGCSTPRLFNLKGYLDPYGNSYDFESIDDFNGFQAVRQAGLAWPVIQEEALRVAKAIQALFFQESLLTAGTLEETALYDWHSPDDKVIRTTSGWFLWVIAMEHETIEHAFDLNINIDESLV
ncbi:MAG TPA: hypothetical protein VN376_06450 [Longilinea sp.]|nr:hypothetical protein [Longilinea sp.]